MGWCLRAFVSASVCVCACACYVRACVRACVAHTCMHAALFCVRACGLCPCSGSGVVRCFSPSRRNALSWAPLHAGPLYRAQPDFTRLRPCCRSCSQRWRERGTRHHSRYPLAKLPASVAAAGDACAGVRWGGERGDQSEEGRGKRVCERDGGREAGRQALKEGVGGREFGT